MKDKELGKITSQLEDNWVGAVAPPDWHISPFLM